MAEVQWDSDYNGKTEVKRASLAAMRLSMISQWLRVGKAMVNCSLLVKKAHLDHANDYCFHLSRCHILSCAAQQIHGSEEYAYLRTPLSRSHGNRLEISMPQSSKSVQWLLAGPHNPPETDVCKVHSSDITSFTAWQVFQGTAWHQTKGSLGTEQ